jgi:hypothetical protein
VGGLCRLATKRVPSAKPFERISQLSVKSVIRQTVRFADLAALLTIFVWILTLSSSASGESTVSFPDISCETVSASHGSLEVFLERCVDRDGTPHKEWKTYSFIRDGEILTATTHGVPGDSVLYDSWTSGDVMSSITPEIVAGDLFLDSCEYMRSRGVEWILILTEPDDQTVLLGDSCLSAVRRITSP